MIAMPTTSELIKQRLGIETAAHAPRREWIGNLSMKDVVEIAKQKYPDMLAKSLKAAVKEVLGTCGSMGVMVEGKDPKIVIKEVDEGKYDDLLKE
ncbi:MAG: hypothetical protein GXO42_00445 [bacterium]|nr:hypothetical protein [bacterium]